MLSCGRVDLLTVGEAFEDLVFAGLERLPKPGEEVRVPRFAVSAGGGAIITAVAAARLEVKVGALTAVESRVAGQLGDEGIRVMNLKRDDERGATSVALSTRTDRSFVTYEGVNVLLEPRLLHALRRRAPQARHVHFALGPKRCRAWLPVLRALEQRGTTTSWDFGWNARLLADRDLASLMNAVTWLFLNEQEARLYSHTASASAARAHWLRRRAFTIVKRGGRGALLLCDGKTTARSGVPARVVDTTGAGDAFNGGFLAALLSGATASDALDVAMYVGARSTEGLGGIAALPRRARLPRRWRQHLEAA